MEKKEKEKKEEKKKEQKKKKKKKGKKKTMQRRREKNAPHGATRAPGRPKPWSDKAPKSSKVPELNSKF